MQLIVFKNPLEFCSNAANLIYLHIFAQGLDDLFGGTENVTSIALISNGADVVKVKRKFFLKHAPTNLLMKLSGVVSKFPYLSHILTTYIKRYFSNSLSRKENDDLVHPIRRTVCVNVKKS